MNYLVPAKTIRIELKVKNSRFLVTAGYVASVDDAREFISKVKQEFPDATHNVPAYIVGYGSSSVEHCNDDGEPGGTSGRPMLAVLKGSNLGDIAIVASRYFGGTKLGTGGLVQAYSAAAKSAVDALPLARKTWVTMFTLRMPYTHYEPVRRAVQDGAGVISNEVFAEDVSFEATFKKQEAEAFLQYADERWGGGTIELKEAHTMVQVFPENSKQD